MSDFRKDGSLRRLTVCALFAALICVLSPIAIPIGAIPLSLGFLGVLLCAVCLPPLMSLTAALVYLAIGACGLPVFSGALGGAQVLIGPTGGYLWSYPVVGLVVAVLCKAKAKASARRSFAKAFFACLIGVLICYLLGVVQYVLVTETPIGAALAVCVLPFLPIDLGKALLAVALGKRLSPLLSRRL